MLGLVFLVLVHRIGVSNMWPELSSPWKISALEISPPLPPSSLTLSRGTDPYLIILFPTTWLHVNLPYCLHCMSLSASYFSALENCFKCRCIFCVFMGWNEFHVLLLLLNSSYVLIFCEYLEKKIFEKEGQNNKQKHTLIMCNNGAFYK